jgi:hypothetical protein
MVAQGALGADMRGLGLLLGLVAARLGFLLVSLSLRGNAFGLGFDAGNGLLPGQHHTRTGIPSRVTAGPMTICGRSSRWSSDLP